MDKIPTYDGVWPGSQRRSLMTLLSLPQCHAALGMVSEKTHITYYNVDIKHGERDLILQSLGRSVAIYTRCGLCNVYDFICRVFCKFINT
jgi:hypothetical protein